jgi:thioredoxin reductase
MKEDFDVIIVGGSYAGLSAAMALGRSLRNTLVIDSGKPCNRQTPHSHNFITHDGNTPLQISSLAKQQVMRYPSVKFVDGLVVSGRKMDNGFEVDLEDGKQFTSKKLLFTTGMKDIMPPIDGFAECWGISVLHCPYCHGYEVRNEPTGIFANGDMAFELTRLIHHWTKDLVLFTNGSTSLTPEQRDKVMSKGIRVVETTIGEIEHVNGYVKAVHLKDGGVISLKAIYARPELVQHCAVPDKLSCEITPQNLLTVDMFQRTTVSGVYAAGDCTTMMRSVSMAVASGGFAGAAINKELIEESF